MAKQPPTYEDNKIAEIISEASEMFPFIYPEKDLKIFMSVEEDFVILLSNKGHKEKISFKKIYKRKSIFLEVIQRFFNS